MDGPAIPTVGVDVRILGNIPPSREQPVKTSTDEAGQSERRPSRRRYNRDEFATVYASPGDIALLSRNGVESGGEAAATFGEGSLCRLIRFVRDESSTSHTRPDEQARLWAPVILRQLPELAEKNGDVPGDGGEDASCCDSSGGGQHQRSRARLFVPPNVAATIGLQQLHIPLELGAHLQPLPKRDLTKATRATLVEIGRNPPQVRLRRPVDGPAPDDKTGSGVELREYFLSSGATQESKPRQRLLALGSIISTPVHKSRFDPRKFETCRYIDGVVLYQVTEIDGSVSTAQQDRGGSDLANKGQTAYVVSPSTHLVLDEEASGSPIHPQLGHARVANHTWRLPRMSKCLSCLRSLANSDEVHVGPLQIEENVVERSCAHPSAGKLADAIYLQGAIPAQPWVSGGKKEVDLAVQSQTPIINVIGTEENFLRACIDEAADLSEYLRLVENLATQLRPTAVI